jgi:WD40 repeat protein
VSLSSSSSSSLSPLSMTLTQVTLLDLETGGTLRELTAEGYVTSVAVYEESVGGELRTRVAVGAIDLRIYDEETGECVRSLPNRGTSVASMVAYRPIPQEGDGGEEVCRLVSGHYNGSLRVWAPELSGKEEHELTDDSTRLRNEVGLFLLPILAVPQAIFHSKGLGEKSLT